MTQTCQNVTNGNGTSGLGAGSTTVEKVGVLLDASHSIIGVAPSQITFKLAKVGSPTGSGDCKIYNASGSLVATSTNTKDWSTLTTSYTDVAFTFTSTTLMADGFRIVIEGGTTSSGNEVSCYACDPSEYSDMQYTLYRGSAWVDFSSRDANFCYTSGSAPSGGSTLLPPPVAWI
jgi:hypothetical protein